MTRTTCQRLIHELGEDRNAPEQIEEPKQFQHKSEEWPFDEYEEDTAEETEGPPYLLFPCEEIKCLLWPDDKEEAA